MNASLSMKKLVVLHFSSYSTSKKEGSVKVEDKWFSARRCKAIFVTSIFQVVCQ